MLAFAAPFLATLLLTPIAARLATRLGLLDHPSSSKFHREATPYLGGLAVAGGLVLVGGLTAGASGQVLTILLCGLALGIVGLVDDWRTVGPGTKLVVEAASGVALWLVGVRAGLFGVDALDLLLTVFWVVAVTNAINLVDNMDGLLPGIAAIAALSLFAIAALQGDYLVASFALALAGASLGFLRHNFPPAKIFLGDAGSLLLGFLLAAVGLKLDLVGEQGLLRAAVPVLVLGLPLLDTCLVIVARLRSGRPAYRGATDHTSHRLARLGLSERTVALLLYGAQAGLCGLAVWLTGASSGDTVVAVAAAGAVALLAFLFLLALPDRDGGWQAAEMEPEAPGAAIGIPVAERL